MAANHRAREAKKVEAERRSYLGEVFLKFYPPDEGLRWGFSPLIDVNPQIIAANCLGITYGDPGPRLDEGMCRECWGERHIWLGNAWGIRHIQPSLHPAPGRMHDCNHECHNGELWMASAGETMPEDSAASTRS